MSIHCANKSNFIFTINIIVFEFVAKILKTEVNLEIVNQNALFCVGGLENVINVGVKQIGGTVVVTYLQRPTRCRQLHATRQAATRGYGPWRQITSPCLMNWLSALAQRRLSYSLSAKYCVQVLQQIFRQTYHILINLQYC
jgi:hypothetical protein